MSQSSGPEAFGILEKPQISLPCGQLPQLEKLLYSDVENVTIAEDLELQGPITSIRVQVDGSSMAEGGNFSFGSLMELDHNSSGEGVIDEEAARIISFVESFAFDNYGKPIEGGAHYYLIKGRGRANYVMALSEDLSQLFLTSTGTNVEELPEDTLLDREQIHPLSHGQHATIPEFNNFRYTLTQIITQFYDAQGYNGSLSLPVKISEAGRPQLEEEDSEPGDVYPTMKDVGGLHYVKEQLQQYATQLRNPGILEKYGVKPRRGVLLYGPGGTGKTMLAKAFQHEIDADMIRLSAADIYDMWLGNSEKAIRKVFDDAKKVTKSTIIYFNEIDGIITPGSHSTDSRVAAIFKQGAEELVDNPNAILWADSNKNLDELDSAIVRSGRFDIRLHVPVPDEQGLKGIIGAQVMRSFKRAERVVIEPALIDYNILAKEAVELTGADIENILNRMLAYKAMQEVESGVPAEPISQDYFVQAIRNFRTR
ncbi:MAG: ATP-binding protein [bacterium]|nr:ATP-binding protein [bacterium]